jgi:hypothetical protein
MLIFLAVLLFLNSTFAQEAIVGRPQINSIGKSSAVRREEQKFIKRVREKRRENPELFEKLPPLTPMKTAYPPSKGKCGQTALFDRTVTTAVVVMDELMARYDLVSDLLAMGNETVITSTSFAGLEAKIVEQEGKIRKRVENARSVLDQLPLAYEEWPSVLAGQCPQANFVHTASERGVALAHSMIWKDWYFRHTTKKKRKGCDVTLPVNGDPSGTKDILVVFEDDVHTTLSYPNLGPALIRELENMSSLDGQPSLVFLGWCFGGRRSMPMCSHAYALNLAAARVLTEQFDPCGLCVDGQWHELVRTKQLRWRKAHPDSYNGTSSAPLVEIVGPGAKEGRRSRRGEEGREEYFRGLFSQAKLGTFNGHKHMPNAA